MHLRSFSKTAVSMLAVTLVGALLAVGCSDDDDNGGGGGDIGSHGSRLVGDWTYEGFVDWNNQPSFVSFKSNGAFCWSYFRKADNFWVGGESCVGTWSANNQHIDIIYEYGYEERLEYTVSNSTFTLLWCDDEEPDYCGETVYTRGGSRPTGTIRSGATDLDRTDWRSQSDYGYLEFYDRGAYLYESNSNYFSDYYNGRAWYTNGNRLFMLGLDKVPNSCRIIDGDEDDCAYTVAETVEFTYTHVPRTSLRLVNSSRGIDDTWEYRVYDDYYKRSEDSETDKRQNLFRRPQSHRALSKR